MLRKKRKREYWGPEEEKAVIDYLNYPPGHPMADTIFREKLYEPLQTLVENIMFTYNLSIADLPIDEQIFDCMSVVTQKMRKFKPEMGCKSFSYFGTIAKNDLIAKSNKHRKNKIQSVDIENVVGFEMDQNLYIDHEFEIDLESNEFLLKLVANDIKQIMDSNISLEPNIYKIGEAVVYLLNNYQYMSIQNKRQFYFIMKEFTGLKTKEITSAMNKINQIFKKTCKENK